MLSYLQRVFQQISRAVFSSALCRTLQRITDQIIDFYAYFKWIALFITAPSLAYVLYLVMTHHMQGDQYLYMTVGRSILNGLKPWQDLFETKPPIIFWISALSLLWGGDWLYRILLISGVLSMIFVFARNASDKVFSLVFSCFLGIYIVIASQGYNTEAFSALPIALGLFSYREKQWIVPSFCWGLLFLLKEPFIVTYTFALVLIRRDISIFKIVLTGISSSLIVLSLSGNLLNYFEIYLPEMLGGRVNDVLRYPFPDGSVHLISSNSLVRALYFRKLAEELLKNWGLGLSLLIFAHNFVSLNIFSVLFLLTGINLAFALHQITSFVGHIPWRSTFFLHKLAEASLLITVSASLIKTRKVMLLVFAVLLVNFTAGLGGFFQQHFVFAVPIWIFLYMKFEHSSKSGAKFLVCLALSAACFALPGLHTLHLNGSSNGQAKALLVDQLLDACGYDRYMIYDQTNEDITGYTLHSPWQLPWGISRSFDDSNTGRKRSEKLHSILQEAWDKTEVYISNTGAPQTFFPEYPDCAKPFEARAKNFGITIYFKKV
jgi:hypothetical protein